jgi:phosphomannomutase
MKIARFVPIWARHAAWPTLAPIAEKAGFPACQVACETEGKTLRQAAVAAGVDPDADRLIVGIPEACF